jgi:cystathionine beta-lyase
MLHGLPIDVLRARRNAKWSKYGADILPAWVAEMDFTIAYPIRRAMARMVEEQDYGYPLRDGAGADKALAASFARRMESRYGWAVDPALVEPLTDLVQGQFATIWAYSEPGDGVILHLPAYPPFHRAILETGRHLLANRMLPRDGRFELDLADMAALAKKSAMLMLCNPQNPTGRVFTRAELEAMAAVVLEHDLIVVSDEIHSDLIYDGLTHIPFASLSPEIAARTITITSATKGFNIPGLRCAVMHFGTADLQARFRAKFPAHMLGQPGIMGIDATVAAWDESQAWQDDVVATLEANRNRIAAYVAAELPGVAFYKPEGTYLGWMDCTGLNLPGTAHDFFHERAKVAFSGGENFDPHCAKFARFNFATSPEILEAILGRMSKAVRSHNS